MAAELVGGSFRDPSGFVFRREGVVYRQVNEAGRESYDALMGSGLYDALVDERLLLPHEDVDAEPASDGAYRILMPEGVPFISYPWEWSFSHLKDTALTLLQIQSLALEAGCSLRDASAFNMQFHEGRHVLIDTLSFTPLREGEPWVGYGQFCRHFLAPLALMARSDVRLGQLFRSFIDGIPLDLASRLLPKRSRPRAGLLLHIRAHARAVTRSPSPLAQQPEGGRMGRRALTGLIDSLRSTIAHLEWDPESRWTDYYREGASYSQESSDAKVEIVGRFLDEIGPATVWDLGSNTGMFSELATNRGVFTVAFDADPAVVEQLYRKVRESHNTSLLPLITDLANPTPALGWNHRERASLVERGPADLALALALVHHLAIGNNVPLALVADFLAGMCRTLVIEFVPKDDPLARTLLSHREDVFSTYSLEGFEKAMGSRFQILQRERISSSERILYLMRAVGA